MNNNTTSINFNELTSEICKEAQWIEILEILKDTKMDFWKNGKEKYEDFYVVCHPIDKNVICFFTFSQEKEVGILKNFVVDKKYQKLGIGTHLANNIVPAVAKKMGIKRLYLYGNNNPPYTSNYFWKKTKFKHININEVKDSYYKDKYDYLVKIYTEKEFYRDSVFIMEI